MQRNLFSPTMYNSSPVESCFLHIIHVKQFKWNTLFWALRTRSLGEIPCEQPAHFVPNRLQHIETTKNSIQFNFKTKAICPKNPAKYNFNPTNIDLPSLQIRKWQCGLTTVCSISAYSAFTTASSNLFHVL